MNRHRFYVGTQGNGGQVRHDLAEDYLLSVYGGYSVLDVAGAWRDEHGRVWREPSKLYECLTTDEVVSPRHVAEALGSFCNQKSVLYTSETVQGDFV